MSKQLYEEALADVKKLKEIAEDNAKKALIEAVSPRIKDLIEAELLREAGEREESVTDDLLLDDELEGSSAPSFSEPQAFAPTDPSISTAISPPDEEGKVTLDLDALTVEPAGDEEFELSNESLRLVNPLLGKVNRAVSLQIESKLFHLGETVEKFIGASKIVKNSSGYKKKIAEMVSDVEGLYEYLQESAGDLQDKGVYEGKLEDIYKKLNKLTEQNMKKNWRSLSEADITLKLTGVPDEVTDELGDIGVDLIAPGAEGAEEDEVSDDSEEAEDTGVEDEEGGDDEELLDLGDEEDEGEEADEEEESKEEAHKMESRRLRDNMVVEIDEGMLRREIARMKALREDAEVQAWGSGAGDLGDLEDDDLGEPLELDLRESDVDEMQHEAEVDELEQEMQQEADVEQAYQGARHQGAGRHQQSHTDEMDEMDEMDQAEDTEEYGGVRDEAQSRKQSRQPGKTVESIRRSLAREARIQLEAKKQAKQSKQKQTEAQKKQQKKQQEAQMKQKQRKQQEAQKAKQEAQKQAKQAKQMKEAYEYYAKVYNESVRRTDRLRSMLAESNVRSKANLNGSSDRSAAETNNLRNKLAETNLFNTKLLYCNKLLQNEAFTKRQKAEIIERLDEARNEREVKLVYESLTKALGNTSRSLSEGRVVGSSSQATRPASTVLNEGVETDRWARLAGIK